MQHKLYKPGQLLLDALPPLSLYIHVPWCVRKCPYCDFNSHVAPNSPVHLSRVSSVTLLSDVSPAMADSVPVTLQTRYINALLLDLDQQLPSVWGRRLHSIFIGGGTPSLLHPSVLDHLLSEIRARLGMPVSGEITLEANPGTFEQDRFQGFKQAGVTRLSLGVQSLNDHALKRLGRVHSPEQALQALDCAVKLFDRVNVDLMYGLPGLNNQVQTVEQAIQDLQQILARSPGHLSMYELTLEPNTLFALKPPKLPTSDTLVEIEDALYQQAQQAGYSRYEVSAFSKPNQRCLHNLNYWQFGDYLAIGAGAHAKLTYPDRIERQVRLRNPEAYLHALETQQSFMTVTQISASELPFEFMLNVLRLVEGVPEYFFQERCGRPISDLQLAIQQAVEKNLLANQVGVFKPTALGLRYLNDLQQLFL